jgi:hypothetical protein
MLTDKKNKRGKEEVAFSLKFLIWILSLIYFQLLIKLALDLILNSLVIELTSSQLTEVSCLKRAHYRAVKTGF